MIRAADGLTGDAYVRQMREVNAAIDEINRKTGDNWNTMGVGSGDAYESYMEDAASKLKVIQETQSQLDELMATYQEFYNSKIELALNPEDFDLDGTIAKIQEIQKLTDEISGLNETLAGQEKGSEEYGETEQKIADAKTRQEADGGGGGVPRAAAQRAGHREEHQRRVRLSQQRKKLSIDTSGLGAAAS